MTGANMGMFGVFTGMRGGAPSSSRCPPVKPGDDEAAGASATWPGTWTGLVMRGAEPLAALGGELERFMNAR
jgi:hypothetical protein